MSENNDFDAIIKGAFEPDDETETPSLAGAVDALMATNEELRARLAFYEEQASKARGDYRTVRDTNSAHTAKAALKQLKLHLRNIHPTTTLDG